MNFETAEPRQQRKSTETFPEKSSGEILEDAFVNTIQRRILDTFSDELEGAGFSEEQVKEFRQELSSLPSIQMKGILSMPLELREMRLPRLHEQIAQNKSTIAAIVNSLAQEAQQRGFTLGYHMSNATIDPRPSAAGGPHAWVIEGREKDHRDNDLPMAYYSTNLANLYGKKNARYIYVVRAETGPNTTHRQDNDGSWGRATGLDVVERLDYETVMGEAREQAKREKQALEGTK